MNIMSFLTIVLFPVKNSIIGGNLISLTSPGFSNISLHCTLMVCTLWLADSGFKSKSWTCSPDPILRVLGVPSAPV